MTAPGLMIAAPASDRRFRPQDAASRFAGAVE